VGGSQRPTASFTIAPGRSSLSGLSLAHTSVNRSALLRLTATETNDMEKNVETLRDLFWTLYSKLDAVLQGFRVSYEVSMRITDVSLASVYDDQVLTKADSDGTSRTRQSSRTRLGISCSR
jgi:hypothetical protein